MTTECYNLKEKLVEYNQTNNEWLFQDEIYPQLCKISGSIIQKLGVPVYVDKTDLAIEMIGHAWSKLVEKIPDKDFNPVAYLCCHMKYYLFNITNQNNTKKRGANKTESLDKFKEDNKNFDIEEEIQKPYMHEDDINAFCRYLLYITTNSHTQERKVYEGIVDILTHPHKHLDLHNKSHLTKYIAKVSNVGCSTAKTTLNKTKNYAKLFVSTMKQLTTTHLTTI